MRISKGVYQTHMIFLVKWKRAGVVRYSFLGIKALQDPEGALRLRFPENRTIRFLTTHL